MKFTFDDLAGDEKSFFTEYFDKKPMLRRKALRGNPGDVLSFRRLDELINLENVRPPYIRVNLNGAGVPEQGYTETITVQGTDIPNTVVPEKVYELYRAGATIVWSSLNHIETSLRESCKAISDKFGSRTDCVAFLTPAGREGFKPHHDPVDLFIVQTEGTKRWRLWNPPEGRSSEAASYTNEQLGEPAIDVLLEAGDVLYLPYGTPHAAAAEDKASVHLSIMIRPRMWKDLLKQTFETLVEDPEYKRFPYIGESREAEVASRFTEKIRMVSSQLATVDVDAELDRLHDFGRRLDSGAPSRIPYADTFRASTDVEDLGHDALLRRSAEPVEIGEDNDGRTSLTFKGHKITVPSPIANVVAGLDTGSSIAAAEIFPGESPERAAKTAQGLTRLGVLELVGTG